MNNTTTGTLLCIALAVLFSFPGRMPADTNAAQSTTAAATAPAAPAPILPAPTLPAPAVPTPVVTVPADQVQAAVQHAVDQQLRTAVSKEVTEQEDVRFRQLKWFVAIVGLIGLGTFGTLAGYLIEKAVETRIERRTNEITESLAFSRFYTIALKLDVEEEFSQPDVDAVMNYLRKVERNSDIRHSPEFRASFLQVAQSFVSAGQSACIDELFDIYEREILTAPHLVQALLRHYGREIVGREIAPKVDASYAAFEKLERVASSSQLAALALAYRTLYESATQNGNDKGVAAKMIRRSSSLDEAGRKRYLFELLLRSRENNWVRTSTPEATKIEATVRSLFCTHADTFETVYGLGKLTSQQIGAQGVDRKEADRLADQIASKASLSGSPH